MRQDRLTDTQGTIASSIWYVGELLEYDNSSGGHSKRFVFAGGARVAVIRRDSTQEVTSYLHQDHLGSTDTITDASGGVVQTLSYDPHGLRRDSDWQDASGAISSAITTRGFTGHEHLEDLKLIHMNGRVYDPVIGRFLSADPAYQNLAGSQTLNRYAYVLNNPLSYTDPSGFFFSKIFNTIKSVFSKAARVVKKAANSVQKVLAKNEIVRAVVVIAVAAITQQYYLATYGVTGSVTLTATVGDAIITGYTVGSQIAASALSGFVSGLVASGGDLKSAALSAVTAIPFVGVGEALGHASGSFGSAQHARKIAAHAVVGGASSELQGGKFAHGALAGGFAQFAAPAIHGIPSGAGQVAASAVAGGIGAELGGGKSANGAVTGAFGRLFNDKDATPNDGDADNDGVPDWADQYPGMPDDAIVSPHANIGFFTGGGRAPKGWPNSPSGMDKLLGIQGTRIPDGPLTPGRNKVEWRPNGNAKIIYEQHPYHPNAPDWHKGPHWHLDTPGSKHQRYLPGDDVPGAE